MKMTRVLKVALLLAVLTVAFGQVAQADTIGTLSLPGCDLNPGGCPAATYSFDIGTTSATLTIHITGGLVVGTNNLIGGVNLGFNSKPPTVTGGTTSFGNSTDWTFETGSLNNKGCSTTSSAGFVCADWTANPKNGGFALTKGGTYTWTWNYNAISAGSIFAVGDIHIGANYNPANGLIVSETGAGGPVPEPGSLLLLGSGLIGLAGIFRRKLMR